VRYPTGRAIALLAFFLVRLGAAQQYRIEQSSTDESLRGLSSVSQKIAWASGTHGTFLRTLDGGRTWQVGRVPGAEALDFRDVEAFSVTTAYLLSAGPGEASRIYKTTDAGKTWKLQYTNQDPKGFFDCMAFWDREHGIVLGDPVDGKFVLLRTDDGGRVWKQISPNQLPMAQGGEGAFAASGSCIAVQGSKNVWFGTGGKVARVFRSSNRGQTWAVAETPIVHGNESWGIFSVAFRDRVHGVIVGGDYKHPQQGGGNLAFSNDGGATWRLSEISPQSYFSAVAFRPGKACGLLAVGAAHAGYAADAQKRKWVNYWDLGLNAVNFVAEDEALAVGSKGTIVHFTGLARPCHEK